MSEQQEVKATLEQRVAAMEADLQILVRLADAEESIAKLYERLNEYQGRVEKQIAQAHQHLVDRLNQIVESVVTDAKTQFGHEVAHEITQKLTKEALSQRVLITRPASREEAKAGIAIPVRQATREEMGS